LVLLIAHPKADAGWEKNDLEYLAKLTRTAIRRYGVDATRAVVAGAGKPGQMAFALALGGRSPFAGAIGIDAPLPRTLSIPENVPGRRLSVLMVESADSSFKPLVRHDLAELREAGYPVAWHESAAGESDDQQRELITRWVDALDRF
jgi:poly(3-hydroxybutyrate) depolymerase